MLRLCKIYVKRRRARIGHSPMYGHTIGRGQIAAIGSWGGAGGAGTVRAELKVYKLLTSELSNLT